MREGEDISEHNRPIKREWWEKAEKLLRLKREIAAAFRARGQDDIARRLDMCSEYEQLVCCGACGGHWWTPYRCKLRCCPICSREKARDRQTYLLAITSQQTRCKMITLTMRRWKGDPREGIKYLRAAVQRFRDTKCMSKCKGGAYTIEVLPKPDGWHIHAHLLVDVPYIPFKVLLRVWSKCLDQPSPHVRIQSACKDAVKKYVCKYASKSMVEEVGAASIVEWHDAIRGSRLWATFGQWYNASLEDLTDGFIDPPKPCPCPHCGAIKASFLARAGPAIFGRDWQAMRHGILLSDEYTRPNEQVKRFLDRA